MDKSRALPAVTERRHPWQPAKAILLAILACRLKLLRDCTDSEPSGCSSGMCCDRRRLACRAAGCGKDQASSDSVGGDEIQQTCASRGTSSGVYPPPPHDARPALSDGRGAPEQATHATRGNRDQAGVGVESPQRWPQPAQLVAGLAPRTAPARAGCKGPPVWAGRRPTPNWPTPRAGRASRP